MPGRGVVDLSDKVGVAPGTTFEWAGARFQIDRPTLADLFGQLKRRAQIVTPKDAMYLLYLAGVGPRSRVAEAGSGSGALTTSSPTRSGRRGRSTRSTDGTTSSTSPVATSPPPGSGNGSGSRTATWRRTDSPEPASDSVVLDLPEPWAVVPKSARPLRPADGSRSYTPTYNQLERTVRALRRGRVRGRSLPSN